MGKVTVFVGVDYHQDVVQVCVMDPRGNMLANRSVGNSVSEIAAVVAPHGTDVRAAIEACSGAAAMADELVTRLGWSVDLAHPGYVSRMKQSPDKTDFGDSRLLADLERVGYLPRVWLAPHDIRELRRLVRYRQQLVDERRNLKLRIGALLRDMRIDHPVARPWTQLWLTWLREVAPLSEQSRWIVVRQLVRLDQWNAEITIVERRLEELTAGDPVVAQLTSWKGVGLITAATIRAEIGRFDRFRTGKQLARFCGVTPRNASSGQRQADAGLIKAGNPQLRAVLIEAAHRLGRYDLRWVKLAARLRRRGKPGSVVAAAVANRWIRWLFHQMQPARQAA